MELQQLYVSLALEAAKFSQGLQQASAQAKSFAGNMQSSINNATQKAQTGLKNLGSGAVDFGKRFTTTMSDVSMALLPIGVALGSVTLAAKQAWQTLSEGAALNAAQGRFENLAASIDTTADALLTKMREATRGVMSDAEMMASASQIISLGLGKTEDQVVRLSTVVGTLGWDMNQVILTMANNSTMRLDALGLSIEDVTSRAKELEAAGMSMDEAFDLAVIEAGEKKMALFDNGAQKSVVTIKQLEAALTDADDAFKKAFASHLTATLDDMAGGVEALGDELVYAAEGAAQLAAALVAGPLGSLAKLGRVAEMNQLIAQVQQLGGELDETFQISHAAAIRSPFTASYEDIVAVNKELEKLLRRLNYYEDAKGDTGRIEIATDEEIRKVIELGKALEEAIPAPEKVADFANGMREAVDAVMGGTAQEAGSKLAGVMDLVAGKAKETAAEVAQAYAAVYQSIFQSGDYNKPLPGSDKPLVTPAHTTSYTVGGPSRDQISLMDEYRTHIRGLQEDIQDLQNGIGTYGVEQEKVNERIADAQGEIEHYQALLEPLAGIVGETVTAHQALSVNVGSARQAIFDQLVQMGAAPEVITTYGFAIGTMSAEQVRAAETAIYVKLKIDELTQKLAEGMPVKQALADFDTFIDKIEQGVRPSIAYLGGEAVTTASNGAVNIGRAINDGIAQGLSETEAVATDAVTDAANRVIKAANSIYQIESPSQVFTDIGDNLGTSTVSGFSDAIDAAQGALEGIGRRVIDGVIAGINAVKATLQGVIEGVANSMPAWLKAALGIASPAAATVPIGVAITEGIIEGIRARALEAMDSDEIVDIVDEMLDSARLMSGISTAFGRVFADRAIDPLEAQLEGLHDQVDIYTESIERMAAMLGLDPNSADFYQDLFWMAQRGGEHQRRVASIAMRFFEDRLTLSNQLATTQDELIAQQEKLLRLEQQRADLDFLRQQYELIKLVRDNNLDAAILEGLVFGVDADAGLLMDAMIAAVQQMIGAVEDELGIHSPSRWAIDLMHNVFETMSTTAEQEAQDLRDSMSRALATGLAPGGVAPDARPQTVDNSRRSVNYGGIHIYGDSGRRSPLDLLQEQLV